jgi:hypothetical protein
LGGEQDFHDVPDAEFSALQAMENPQPRPVGKRPEHQVDVIQYLGLSGLGHIRSYRLAIAQRTEQG